MMWPLSRVRTDMTHVLRKIENGKKNYNTGSFLYHEKYCRESADIQPDNPGFFISGFRSDSGYGKHIPVSGRISGSVLEKAEYEFSPKTVYKK